MYKRPNCFSLFMYFTGRKRERMKMEIYRLFHYVHLHWTLATTSLTANFINTWIIPSALFKRKIIVWFELNLFYENTWTCTFIGDTSVLANIAVVQKPLNVMVSVLCGFIWRCKLFSGYHYKHLFDKSNVAVM